MSYFATATAKLLNGRTSRKLSHNTYARREGPDGAGLVHVKYHATDILTARESDGALILNTGGYLTATTKKRFEELLPKLGCPLRIYSSKGQWWLYPAGSCPWTKDPSAKEYAFADGMAILPDGAVQGDSPATEVKAQAKLAKQITKYAKDYVTALFAGNVAAPGAGDCWGCCLPPDATGTDHLLSHLSDADRYFVPRLLTNAETEFPLSKHCKSMIALMWYHTDKLAEPMYKRMIEGDGYGKKQIAKSIEGYMRKRFGLTCKGGLARKRPGFGY